MSAALQLVRILRRLPHTADFDVHLTNCAALEVVYKTAPLEIAHVLKLKPLASFIAEKPGTLELIITNRQRELRGDQTNGRL